MTLSNVRPSALTRRRLAPHPSRDWKASGRSRFLPISPVGFRNHIARQTVSCICIVLRYTCISRCDQLRVFAMRAGMRVDGGTRTSSRNKGGQFLFRTADCDQVLCTHQPYRTSCRTAMQRKPVAPRYATQTNRVRPQSAVIPLVERAGNSQTPFAKTQTFDSM